MKKHFDIRKYLARTRQIAIVWGIDDVQAVRPDLTDDQAWQVLLQAEERHSAEYGITWDALYDIAGEMFGPEPDVES